MLKLLSGIIYKPLALKNYIYSSFLAAFTWLYGDLAAGLGILIFITIADFITGLLKAGKNGKVESKRMANTAYKLVAYLILIATIHVLFSHYFPSIPGLDPGTRLFPESLVLWFNIVPHLVIAILILREVNSIIENLDEAGFISHEVATFLGKIFSRVNVRINEAAEGKEDDGNST